MDSVIHKLDGMVYHVSLNRPNERNAFDSALIASLTETFQRVPAVARVVVLTGEGVAFSAGADLRMMRASVHAPRDENIRDAAALSLLFKTLSEVPQVTIARVNGAAMGGGLGLVACCDMAVAADNAKFGLTEARLGLIPAVIAPHVVSKIGMSAARRFFLTGEVFTASTAHNIGLVHSVASHDGLDAQVHAWTKDILHCGPEALAHCKALLRTLPTLSREAGEKYCVEAIAERRVGHEAQEGIAAFLEKRHAKWAVT